MTPLRQRTQGGDVYDLLKVTYNMMARCLVIQRHRRVFCYAMLFILSFSIVSRLLLSGAQPIGSFMEYVSTPPRRVAGGTRGFLVDTPTCSIPDVDPYDDTIRHMIRHHQPIRCNATPALTYIHGSRIRINQSVASLHYQNDIDYCLYQGIIRKGTTSDDLYQIMEEATVFRKETEVKSEFIRVVCYDYHGHMFYVNFHAVVMRRSDLEWKCKRKNEAFRRRTKLKENLNVLMVGVDSVSRLNFMRQMVQTRDYLMNKMAAIELKGFNKVADNTYVNLVPMFAGKFIEELPWDDLKDSKPFDEYSFIWKNFSSRGFRTLYAEDAPLIAIFNYAKEGFHTPPSDYYLRPLSLAIEQHGSIWRNGHDCIGDILETEFVLNYVKNFVTTFRNRPHFAFSFITRLTHDNINKAGAADPPYHHFISNLHKQGALNNTVLIFFSDHGMRFGPIRETYIGKLEERLPFMYIAFPQWFYAKYPKIARNLKQNENRLTTPFDIYETLVDVFNFDGKSKAVKSNMRGISLFSEIPASRTCEQAAIVPHWCTCQRQESIPHHDVIIVKITNLIVARINNELALYRDVCTPLALIDITDARRVVSKASSKSTKTHSKHKDTYLLTFRTQPGAGLFEVTVRYAKEDVDAEQSLEILGDISRINEYGNQSACIPIHSLKKYCFCR